MTRSTPVVLAWSGGKDSTLALEAIRAEGRYEVLGLVTAVTPAFDRVSIHGIRRSVLRAQTRSLGLPLVEATLESPSSNEAYEAAWAAALNEAARQFGAFKHVAYGDLFLEDVLAYRHKQLARLGLEPLCPLWGRPTPDLARHFADAGYEAYITCVDTTQLAPAFAGRRYDSALLADLPASVDPCAERGEFHTLTVDGPLFTERVAVQRGEQVLRDERFQFCDFSLAGED